jgi:predicted RecA/RadA family phage recombinase
MATNHNQPACVREFTAPTGGVTSGTPVLIGTFFVIPLVTVAATARFNGALDGEWTLPKTSSETWAEGEPVYFDTANTKLSNDSSLGIAIGVSTAVAGSSDTTASVRLNGVSLGGRLLTLRKRIAVASVNAGATLLAAIAGAQYRMVHAQAIAIGGAAGAVTTVDILATLSSSRKLVAFAQASLTQSTVLKDGGTGAAVLADGASYTANDAGTAVTVGITGSAITTATSIDFSIDFVLE